MTSRPPRDPGGTTTPMEKTVPQEQTPGDPAVVELQQRVKRLERVLSSLGKQAKSDNAQMQDTIAKSSQEVTHTLKDVKKRGKGIQRDFGRLLMRLATVGNPFDRAADERFFEVALPIVEARRTTLDYGRLFTLWQAARNVAQLDASGVEVGTLRGGSAAFLAQTFREFAGRDRELHVVDTFEGHLDDTLSEHDPRWQQGKFRSVSYEDVAEYLAPFPSVHVHQGNVLDVVNSWPDRPYSFVHLDIDLYLPTLRCLEYFGPRVVDGGVVVIDDFEAPTCPGVAIAAREYLDRAPEFQIWRMQPEQALLVKCRRT